LGLGCDVLNGTAQKMEQKLQAVNLQEAGA